MIENVIFDLDGTLVDSSGDIIATLKKAYAVAGMASAVKIDTSCIGPQLPEIIKSITPDISDTDLSSVIGEYRKIYDQGVFLKTRIYSGVYDVLRKLCDMGIKLFLVTNKPMIPTRRIISKLDLDYFFDIITPDVMAKGASGKTKMVAYLIKKFKLRRNRTMVVGDSPLDIAAAHNNGLISVAVANGYSDRASLCCARPDYTIKTIACLLRLISKANAIKV